MTRGKVLKKIRTEHGLTRKQMAGKLHYTYQAYRTAEADERHVSEPMMCVIKLAFPKTDMNLFYDEI